MSPKRVVVVGSGAAGMAAAASAAAAGCDVTVLEKARLLGGTTASSGGGIWIPANPWAAAAGIQDSQAEALRYLHAVALGDSDPEVFTAYVREGANVVRAVERETALRWDTIQGFPDYHAELDGGKLDGRSLEIYSVEVGAQAVSLVRPDPYSEVSACRRELAKGPFDDSELARRSRQGILGRGRGLIAGLYAAGTAHGARVLTSVRPTKLIRNGDTVTGVEARGEVFEGQVVIASGGFERDPTLVRAFLRGPMTAPAGPPSNEGDGLRMGMAAGAALGNMSEAWWCPAMAVPGETLDGAPLYRMLFGERARPGALVVDASGRRFADEAANYNDFGRAMQNFDAGHFTFPGANSWLICDAARRADSKLGPLEPGDPDPAWLFRAETVASLAAAIGLPSRHLVETVERYNSYAAAGADPEFARGSFAWDAHTAGTAVPEQQLRPICEAPFYALRVLPGCLGTKGGLKTNAQSQVLSMDQGRPIPGLYAAGNAAANPFGCAYPGAGSTVGPALVFGWMAGSAAAAG